VIDDLLQAAVFEQYMLSRPQLVGRFAELVGYAQQGSLLAAILYAGVAVSRHAQSQIQRPLTFHCESEVRRHHDIVCGCWHRDFNCAAIESQHQRSRGVPFSCCEMQSAGRAHPHHATSAQRNLCCMFSCSHRRIAYQHRSAIRYFERARYCGVLHANRTDRLLGVQDRQAKEE
jgi:hypothetical protein